MCCQVVHNRHRYYFDALTKFAAKLERELGIKPEATTKIAAICELDGCCMLRDKPVPQQQK